MNAQVKTMKSLSRSWLGYALACLFLTGLFTLTVFADSGPTAIDSAVGAAAASGVQGWLQAQVAHFPWLVAVFMGIGFLRVIFKPVFSLLENYVKSNCTAEQYGNLQKFESGPMFRWLSFALDLLGSIKLNTVASSVVVSDAKSTDKPPTNNKSSGGVRIDVLSTICGVFAFTLALCYLCFGCAKTLEPGGAYALLSTNQIGVVSTNTDIAFFTAETTFLGSYQAVYAICEAERENRALYWKLSPSIKHSLDTIRPQVWQVAQRYIAARQAYIASPTPENLTTLTGYLTEIARLSATAAAAIAPVSTTSTTN